MKLKPRVPACPAHSGGGCSLNGGLRPRIQKPRAARGPHRDRALPFPNESVLRQDIKSVLGPGGSPVSPNSSSGPVFPGRGGAGPRQLHQRARSRGEGGREAGRPEGSFQTDPKIPRGTGTRSTAVVVDVWMFQTQTPACQPPPVSHAGPGPQPPLASPLSPRGGGGLGSARGEGAGKETPADPRFSFLKNS